ncbi:ankyrin repeat protein [Cordyceps fumosorosea ARSEF 2679]|uniref:Ankyrin repeat protein n=1 Tax=Cordyceps fumosorosea (strain ARSEF 2679) TaxID=1081104 RepID=A0A167LFY1_CORFA|nr:ankyrin repeat protein [Cordyceps fumosorosea ARSEF 2679]OAA53041.1 ankyrin repeat protein [Cordyceps fumosorosea ARSEF 2679]
MAPNPFLLAADNSPSLLPLLRQNPEIAKSQDEHGYTLVHAAASYNHLDLLRALINELQVDVNITDEDNETALFVVETVDAAKALVEFGVDIQHRGLEGLTAAEKIESEADFPDVAIFLNSLNSGQTPRQTSSGATAVPSGLPLPPDGMQVTFGAVDEAEVPTEVDQEFQRRIEEFAQRDDFKTPEGQAELRKLVEDAITDQGFGEERGTKTKRV